MDPNTPPPAYSPVPPAPPVSYSPAPQAPQGEIVGKRPHAAASAAVGITLVLTICLPFVGLIVAPIVGIVLGAMGLKSDRKGLAVTGIVLSALLLVGILIFAILYGALIFGTLSELSEYSTYGY